MGCCGEDDKPEQGMVKDRKCRDVLCLLFFLAFWAGMFVVCGIAYQQGDLNRVVYGVDSYGLTCGTVNTMTWKINTSIGVVDTSLSLDFTDQKNLYFLNALELLDMDSILYAKTICVNSCPSDYWCNSASLPCNDPRAFKCPYQAFAQYNLSGKMPGVAVTSTDYYGNLTSIKPINDTTAEAFLTSLVDLDLDWVNTWLSGLNVTGALGGNVTVDGSYYQLASQFPNHGPCDPVWTPTEAYFHRCIPGYSSNFTSGLVHKVNNAVFAVSESAKDTFNNYWNSWSVRFQRDVSDVQKGVLIIVVAGLLGGLVLSAFWMVVLRYLAGVFAWLTLIVINVALLGVTLCCFSLAGLLGQSTWAQDLRGELSSIGNPLKVDQQAWEIIAIIAAVVTGLVFIITLLMISRVRIAVACIKVASQAVSEMPSILFFPMFPFILEIFLVIYWVAVVAMLYTAGDLTATCRSPLDWHPFTISSISSLNASTLQASYTNSTSAVTCYSNLSGQDLRTACGSDPNCYLSYKWNNQLRYAFIYHFFGLLWTNQVIVGVSCVTIAGAIGTFYWSGGDKSRMPSLPVLVAMKNAFVFNIGSIIFGALLIAILQFLRFLLEFLDKKTQQLQKANKLAEWAMCCCKCCMWCLQKIVAFINRNAYIMVAVKGTNYCDSAMTAVKLIVTNALRLVTVSFIADILLALGKLSVAALCALLAFAMTDMQYYNDPVKYPDTYLASPVFPVLISAITGFVVALIFFSVYDMAIDTIMLSFCEDCDANGGVPKWAPRLLMEAMGQDWHKREHEGPAAAGPKSNAVSPVPGHAVSAAPPGAPGPQPPAQATHPVSSAPPLPPGPPPPLPPGHPGNGVSPTPPKH